MPSTVTEDGKAYLRNNRGDRRVFALTGYPGCGKSFVADTLADFSGWPVVGMGDEMKKLYKKFPMGDDRKELPDSTWDMAQALRRTHGPNGPAKACVGPLAGAFVENNVVVLDGVRHPREVQTIERVFECPVHLIAVRVSRETRLERFIERGGYLDDYEDEDVARAVAERHMDERTEREVEEGLDQAVSYANYQIDNGGSKEETGRQIGRLLDDFDNRL